MTVSVPRTRAGWAIKIVPDDRQQPSTLMMAEPNHDAMSATSLRHRRAHAPTSEIRGEVEFLLRDLKQSCRCPLLDQVVAGYHDNSERNTNLLDELRVVERSRSVDSVETASRK